MPQVTPLDNSDPKLTESETPQSLEWPKVVRSPVQIKPGVSVPLHKLHYAIEMTGLHEGASGPVCHCHSSTMLVSRPRGGQAE